MENAPLTDEEKREKHFQNFDDLSKDRPPRRLRNIREPFERLWKRICSNCSSQNRSKVLGGLIIIFSLGVLLKRLIKKLELFNGFNGSRPLQQFLRRLSSWMPFWPFIIRSPILSIPLSDALHQIRSGQVNQVAYSNHGIIKMISNNQSDHQHQTTQIIPGSENLIFAAIARNVPHFQFSGETKKSTWFQSLLPFVLLFAWWRIVRSILSSYSSDSDSWVIKKDPKIQKSSWRRFLGLDSPDNEREASSGKPHSKLTTTFDDVISTAKHEVLEVVEFLNQPSGFEKLGASIPRGLLLVGPAGTGKTLMARAVAAEANVAFLSCCASDFIEVFVGRGARRVRTLFEKAQEQQPCVLFIDELDALGSRGSSPEGSNFNSSSGHEEYVQTLNQFLTEIDGFNQNRNSKIVVIAATNRLSAVDSALLRAGRFDRWISLELPTASEREEILKVSIRKRGLKLSETGKECLPDIAIRSSGLTGADLDCIVNEAAFRTYRRSKQHEHNQRLLQPSSITDNNQITIREDFEDALAHFMKSRSYESRPMVKALPRSKHHFLDLSGGILSPSLYPRCLSLSCPFMPATIKTSQQHHSDNRKSSRSSSNSRNASSQTSSSVEDDYPITNQQK